MSPEQPPHASAAGPPDVEALMAEVRARVQEKLASGVYSAEEIERVRKMEISVRERRDLGPDVDEGISFLHTHWDPTAAHAITSHRPGVGRLIVAGKKGLRRALRPLSALILQRQAAFNGKVAQLLTVALHRTQALEMRYEELLLKFYELKKENQELHRRHQEVVLEEQRARLRLEAMERASLPPPVAPRGAPADAGPAPPAASPVSYLAFEEKHRGPSGELKERQRGYLRHFGGGGPVLDAGCGRGEFLELLHEAGIEAYGVDQDAEMVALCRNKGLRAETGDLLAHLEGLTEGSLGGIFAAQVVEHMTTPQLYAFARLAHAKLAPGGRLLAETINPACLATFAGAAYLDLTHVRPIHPEAMRFLLEALGFREVRLEFSSPFPPSARLQEVAIFNRLQRVEEALVNVVNSNFVQLNELIYGHQDYAVIAAK